MTFPVPESPGATLRPADARRRAAAWWPEALIGAVIVLAAGYLMFRPVPRQTTDWPWQRADQLFVYGRVAALLLATLTVGALAPRAVRRVLRPVLRVAAGAGAVVLAAMAIGRVSQRVGWMWPPVVTRQPMQEVPRLPSAQRAEWAARVAMHRLSELPADAPLTIPAAWPFPPDVQVAVERGGLDSMRVWTRTPDDSVRCAERPQLAEPHHKRRGTNPGTEFVPCEGRAAPPMSQFALPARGDEVFPIHAQQLDRVDAAGDGVADSLQAWPQYRHDGAHDAELARVEATTRVVARWRARISGEVRSSPSVAAGTVVVGAHGTGTLAAFDADDGRRLWSHRLPNWVHQDAVSDGALVVVGFGDNHASFTGRLPAGVAAYGLRSGVRAWTVFDESSVMTSPVIVDGAVVYATASGLLRRRDLATGALLGSRQLPGGVIMAPPVLVGDTLVVSLDPSIVCAVQLPALTVRWCRDVPKAFMMGHYAPTVHEGVVYAASSQVVQALGWQELRAMPMAWLVRAAEAFVSPRFFAAAQRLHAIRLHDGAPMWDGPLRAGAREVGGHPAGTAVIAGDVGAIIYPAQDSLVGFDVRTGATRWVVPGHGTRGPPLLYHGLLIHAGRDGSIESRDVQTGALRCRVEMPAGFDRAGPALSGGMLYVGDVRGGVHAVPLALLTQCGNARYSGTAPSSTLRLTTDG
ncbi:MAG: PQQ-binding-like beta-propeller repeat protein [Gemmatimonadetes bacterium]|nr:PQQ-binding-like beta-propeller repeat protein [Gemmatimonadota bacterium]